MWGDEVLVVVGRGGRGEPAGGVECEDVGTPGQGIEVQGGAVDVGLCVCWDESGALGGLDCLRRGVDAADVYEGVVQAEGFEHEGQGAGEVGEGGVVV